MVEFLLGLFIGFALTFYYFVTKDTPPSSAEKDLRNELAEQKQKNDDTITRLNATISNLEYKKNSLNFQLNDIKKERNALLESENTLLCENSNLQDEILDLKIKFDEYEEKLDEYKDNLVKRYNIAKDKFDARIKELEDSLHSVKNEYAAYKTTVSAPVDNKQQIDSLKHSLSVEKEQHHKTITDKNTLEKKIDALKTEHNNLLQKYSEIQQAYKNNFRLFYIDSKSSGYIFSKLEAKKLARSFDPTLIIHSAEYKISHLNSNEEPYTTSLFSCQCPDFNRNSKQHTPCKHMIFLAYTLGNMFYYKDKAEKYFKENISFMQEKEAIEQELKIKRRKLKELKLQTDTE